mmetsp:Transcript_3221/g.3675  ORF Transcript_3221/g.3675 Transcript_3221/m.3675 type:complete len:90 (+) Transcript_3221:148-417(+)
MKEEKDDDDRKGCSWGGAHVSMHLWRGSCPCVYGWLVSMHHPTRHTQNQSREKKEMESSSTGGRVKLSDELVWRNVLLVIGVEKVLGLQ